MKSSLYLPLLLLLAACSRTPVASTPAPAAPAASQPAATTAPAATSKPAATPAPATVPEPAPTPAPAAPASDAGSAKQEPVACTDPRPQVCTAMYDPVCATRDTGVRCITTPSPSEEKKTMGNACSACSDPKVYSWVKGECPAP